MYQEQVLRRSANEFPLVCLSNATLDRLEQLSLRAQRNLFSHSWNVEQETAHRVGFHKVVQSKTFCSVDIDQTLQDPTWRDFFASASSEMSRVVSNATGEENQDDSEQDEERP